MAVRVRGGVVVEVERGMRQRVVVSRRRHVNFALGWRRLSTHSNYSPIRRYSPSPLRTPTVPVYKPVHPTRFTT